MPEHVLGVKVQEDFLKAARTGFQQQQQLQQKKKDQPPVPAPKPVATPQQQQASAQPSTLGTTGGGGSSSSTFGRSRPKADPWGDAYNSRVNGNVAGNAAAAAAQQQPPCPSSSSRATPKPDDAPRVFPEQLVTQDVGALGEYEQFVCKICNLVVRRPVVLPCAHMFCETCLDEWIEQRRPNVTCPMCDHAVSRKELVHFEARFSGGGALALLHRLYSGMKVRCIYHPDLEGSEAETPEAARARLMGLQCNWRGAMHDYKMHLEHRCKVQEALTDPANAATASTSSSSKAAVAASSSGGGGQGGSGGRAAAGRGGGGGSGGDGVTPSTSSAVPGAGMGDHPASPGRGAGATAAGEEEASFDEWHVQGIWQATAPWEATEAGVMSFDPGCLMWASETDASGYWFLAQKMEAPNDYALQAEKAWVPHGFLRRAPFQACGSFDGLGQVQSLSFKVGDYLYVYHRETSGWTFGARVVFGEDGNCKEVERGWFPEGCVGEPLPPAA
mmetsp:Transcript_76207/g.166320  ORF Transcript_76207/g.166320 Transcript_76207/m.166320 type:complete len:501 (+) Transcript_76207:264-1766(+)